MPDMIQPVGAMINPPNPQQGLQSLSAMIGIKRQQQALQTGAAELQSKQLEAGQQQGVQNFFSTWDPSQHRGDDGTTDLDSALQSDEFKAAGNAKPVIMQSLLDLKNKQLANKQSLTTLNNDTVNQFARGMGALAKDDDVVADKTDPVTGVNAGRAKVGAFIQNFSKLGPDAARVAQIYAPVTQHPPPGKLSSAVTALQMQGEDVASQQTQQNPMPVSQDFGPGVAYGAAPKSTGIPTFNGPVIQKGLTPEQRLPHQVVTPAGVVNVSPGGTMSAPPQAGGAPAGAPNLNPSQPQATGANAVATTDSGRYAQVSQEGTNATAGAQLADQVSDLAKQVRTGKLTKEWSDRLTMLRQHDPSVTDRQMLAKYAAQLKTMATQGATTDASRSQIDEGMPSPETMDPDAVRQASQYVGGIFRMRGARQAHADQYLKNNNGSPLGIQGADDAFMRAADPSVFAYKALPAGQARQEFAKEHGLTDPAKAQAFAARMNQINHYGGQ